MSTTKTLDLRGLSDYARQTKINETLAGVEGWTLRGRTWHNPNGTPIGFVPSFSTSADAVLPLLEKSEKDIIVVWSGGTWSVEINEDRDVGTENYNVVTLGSYDDPSFAQAACIALLRANGYEVLP